MIPPRDRVLESPRRGGVSVLRFSEAGWRDESSRAVTGLALIKTPTGSAVLVANNGHSPQALTIRRRSAPRLPPGILLQRVLTPNLAQLDLDGRERKQIVPKGVEGSRTRLVESPGSFNGNVVVDRRIGYVPASQIEEPLTLHRQLQPALNAHGRSSKGLGPWCRIPPHLVARPGFGEGIQGSGRVKHRCDDIAATRPRSLSHLPGPGSDLINDNSGVLRDPGFNLRLGQFQQQVRIPEEVNVNGIQLRGIPANCTRGATGLFVGVLLGAVRTRECPVPDPDRVVHSPILVRYEIPADCPVQPRINRNHRGDTS